MAFTVWEIWARRKPPSTEEKTRAQEWILFIESATGTDGAKREAQPCVELEVWHQDSFQKSQESTTERPNKNFSSSETEFQRKVGLPGKKGVRAVEIWVCMGAVVGWFCASYQPGLHLIYTGNEGKSSLCQKTLYTRWKSCFLHTCKERLTFPFL